MLSTQTKYALRALLSLSEDELETESDSGFVSVKELADYNDIPPAFLSKIVKVLAEHRLIDTKRGRQGGVRATGRSFTFHEVCEALDDPILRDSCFLSNDPCDKESPCRFHSMWSKRRKEYTKFLKTLKIHPQ